MKPLFFFLLATLVTEVTPAGLVKEGVPGVRSLTRDLLPHAVLTLDVAAAQMAALHTSFVTLDPGHLGDLSQSPSLGSCSTAHPGGHSAAGSWGSCWFSHSAADRRKKYLRKAGEDDIHFRLLQGRPNVLWGLKCLFCWDPYPLCFNLDLV